MNSLTLKSFVKIALELQSDDDTPSDYVSVRAALNAKYPGIIKESEIISSQMGMQQRPPSKFSRFTNAASAEAGPAAGAVLGAGVANMYGVNPLAGAAAGYGLGAIPEVIHGFRHRVR